MGFSQNSQYYSKAYLLFRLSTAFAIFNLFAKGFYQILESQLLQIVLHYLDDFIRIILAAQATQEFLAQLELDYHTLTDLLRVLENTKKDASRTIVTTLRITLNTNNFQASLLVEKIAKAIKLTAIALAKRCITLLEVQTIGGYLSQCLKVVRLSKVYLHYVQQFLVSFLPSAKPST